MEETISSPIGAAEGKPAAGKALFSALYSELRWMARRELGRLGVSASVTPTTLLHEAYLDIAAKAGTSFPDRARFLSYAARVMRGLIIDVRSRHAQKRGGHFELTSLESEEVEPAIDGKELTRVGQALDELAGIEAGLAEVVDLKFFCGFSFSEIARMRGVLGAYDSAPLARAPSFFRILCAICASPLEAMRWCTVTGH